MSTARQLAKEKEIEDLVDIDVFERLHRVEASLKGGSTVEALAWCRDHAPMMKKSSSTLEFELRLQQYIELRRAGKALDQAKQHANKYLQPYAEARSDKVYQAIGLLAYPPGTGVPTYEVGYGCKTH